MRRMLTAIFAALAIAITSATVPVSTQPAAANVDVYVTPGDHVINGRQWRTNCENYSPGIDRCWTYIWMTKVELVGGKQTLRTGYHFNSLTYKAAPLSLWGTNPLANTGEFESQGRRWKTSCYDDWTGPNGCRSFIWTKWLDYRQDANGRGYYVQEEAWVFNNAVRFSAASPAVPPSWTPEDPASPSPSTSPTSTRTPYPKPTPTPTPTVSPSPSPTPSLDPCVTPTPTSSPAPTETDAPSGGPIPTTDPTADPCETQTPEPSPSPTPSTTTTTPPNLLECGAPIPAGYSIHAGTGRPYVTNNPGYTPVYAYNPISIANYIQAVNRFDSTQVSHEAKKCAMVAAGQQLINGSEASVYNGKPVRWLPYEFSFSANPSTPRLEAGWYSGLGQSGSLGSMRLLYEITQDTVWLQYAQELANALDIPYEAGGIKDYVVMDGVRRVWFEEYPTDHSPTTVLNGNNLVVLGLRYWADFTRQLQAQGIWTYDARSAELSAEGLKAYPDALPLIEVPTGGGIMSSYDLVRGYATTPLRLVNTTGGSLQRVTLNGSQISMPVLRPTNTPPNRFVDPTFTTGWSSFDGFTNTTVANGVATSTTRAGGHVGVRQIVQPGTFPAGAEVVVQFDARYDKAATGKTNAPWVSAYASCPGVGNLHLLRHTLTRGGEWGTYSTTMTAPATDCAIVVQFISGSNVLPGSRLQWRNPVIRLADPQGVAYLPTYDLFVHRTPKQELKLYGNGTYALEAYKDGRWERVAVLDAAAWGRAVIIPERFTGRNINYNYHESHIYELQQLRNISGMSVFDHYRSRWIKTAINTPG